MQLVEVSCDLFIPLEKLDSSIGMEIRSTSPLCRVEVRFGHYRYQYAAILGGHTR
jgi:hypothetical protein